MKSILNSVLLILVVMACSSNFYYSNAINREFQPYSIVSVKCTFVKLKYGFAGTWYTLSSLPAYTKSIAGYVSELRVKLALVNNSDSWDYPVPLKLECLTPESKPIKYDGMMTQISYIGEGHL